MGRKFDFELLIMRHGDAEDRSPTGDAGRALTERGGQRIDLVARAFGAQEWYWSEAFVSPYLRAQQTYERVFGHIGPKFEAEHGTPLGPAEETPLLLPSANVVELAHMITDRGHRLAGPRPRIVVFGHNPCVSRLAGLLVGGDHETHFAVGTGGVVHLFVPAPSPFDMVLDPKEREPLTRAVVLGFYPSLALEAMGQVS